MSTDPRQIGSEAQTKPRSMLLNVFNLIKFHADLIAIAERKQANGVPARSKDFFMQINNQ